MKSAGKCRPLKPFGMPHSALSAFATEPSRIPRVSPLTKANFAVLHWFGLRLQVNRNLNLFSRRKPKSELADYFLRTTR